MEQTPFARDAYEPPAIEERTALDAPLIGVISGPIALEREQHHATTHRKRRRRTSRRRSRSVLRSAVPLIGLTSGPPT